MDPRKNPRWMKLFGHVAEDVVDIIDVAHEEELHPVDVLTVAVLLSELDVRDAVLCHAAVNGGEDETALIEVFNRMTYAITEGVAPVATSLAILLWMQEDCERALIALDIALSDDPSYSLAKLFYQMVHLADASPEEIRTMMSVDLLS